MSSLPKNIDVATLEKSAGKAAVLLRSIGSKWRLLILCQLAKAERSVGELERAIGLSQSALSQHLMVLRRHELVKTRRSAQQIFYSLNGREVSSILKTLYDLYCRPASKQAKKMSARKRVRTKASNFTQGEVRL